MVAHDGLGLAVGRCLGLFNAIGSMVGLQDPEWIQGTLNVLIGFFRRYGLVANVTKSNAITFQIEEIRSGMPEVGVGRRCTGRG